MRYISVLTILLMSSTIWGQRVKSEMLLAFRVSDKYVRQGNKFLNQKQYDRARGLFNKAIKKNEWAYDAQSFLGIIYNLENNPKACLESMEKGIQVFEKYKAQLISEKKIMLSKVDQDLMAHKAEMTIEKQQEMFTKFEGLKAEISENQELTYPAMFRFQYGNAFLMLKDLVKAKEQYLKIVADDPSFPNVYANLSWCFFNEGNNQKAKEFFVIGKEKGCQFHPDFEKKMLEIL